MAPVPDDVSEIAVRALQPSKSFDLASSTNSSLDNDDPRGVAGWGDELWVINNDSDRRFRYHRSDGTSAGAVRELPDSANSNATGAWIEGSTLWVADWSDTRLYAYSIAANGDLSDRSSGSDIDLTGANDGPRGVSGHSGTVWVVDKDDTYVYAYDTSTRQRVSGQEFDLKGGNGAPWGIWTDGSVAWVNDEDDLIIRAYDLTASGEPLLTDDSIDLDPRNRDPKGMWSDGETLWVADSADDYVYAYDLDDSRKASKDIDLTGANDHPIRIAGDGTAIWVADSDDTYVYAYLISNGNRSSSREFDMDHSGHSAADGMWVRGNLVWMLENQDKTLYTYNKSSGATTDDGFTVGLGSGVPLQGMWGNSGSIWLAAPRPTSALYAYSHSGNSQAGNYVNLSKGFNTIKGVWSDGTVVWTLEAGSSAGLFAHRLSNGNRLNGLDIALSPQNGDPVGVYGHGETIWVGDGDDTKLYAYEKPSYTDPSFPEGDATTRTVDENVAANTSVGERVDADEPDGDPLTYTMTGTDADLFTIESAIGQIRVKAGTNLNAEVRSTYEVVVHVTDNRNLNREADATIDDSITVTINVNNLDEAGTVDLSTDDPRSGGAVDASLTDPDGTVSDLSWQWSRRLGRSGRFTDISGATGVSYTPADGDEGYYLRATASYTDPQGPNKTAHATTARAVVIPNDHPTFDDGATTTRSVDENAAAGTAVGTPVGATDSENDTLTYSLTGDDASAFTVDASTGQIRVGTGTTLNFESRTTFAVTVRVSDRKDDISQADDVIDDTIAVTINVGNVDEAGEVTLDTGAPQQGVEIAATLTDPDGSLSGRSWQWWRGTSSTGPWNSISGATGSDYTPVADDVDGYLRVTVSYTDGAGSGKSAEVVTAQSVAGPTIVNEAPSFDEGTTTGRSVDENAAAGTNVGARVLATDPDGDSLTYSLASTTLFAVNSATGQIRVAAGATLNFESESSHSLTLRVTDNKSPTGDTSGAIDDFITVTVTVDNLDELGIVSFNTGAPAVNSAVEASLSDPDGVASAVTWQWSRRKGTTGTFGDIIGATASSYTPATADLGYFLRATASYDDDEGGGKSANGIVAQAVARDPTVPLVDERSPITVRVRPQLSTESRETDQRAILATQFLATAVPTENAPEGCIAVAGYSTVDGNGTPGTADDAVLIALNVIKRVALTGEVCRYDVTLEPPLGFTTLAGGGTIKGVQPGITVSVGVAIAGRNVVLLQSVVGDSGGATARYELSTNCGSPVLPPALQPKSLAGDVAAVERLLAVELRQGRYNISPALSPDPESPRAWVGVPIPAVDDEGEACEASVAILDLPARCVAERSAVDASLPGAVVETILEFKLMCSDSIEAEGAAVISDDDELDSPVRVEVITPTIAGTYKVAWATSDGCDPGAGTSGMSGWVTLTVAGSAGPDSPQSPGEHTGTAETAPVMISPACAYTWWASAVEASTGAACRVSPAPLVPDEELRMPLTLPDPADLCTGDSTITVRVHPYAGTEPSAVLDAPFAATAVPAAGAPQTCSTAIAESAVDDNRTAADITDDAALIRLPVLDRTADQQVCRYDVTLLPPAGFWASPAGAIAENLEADTSVDFLTSTGGPVRTFLLVQNVSGAPDGAGARFTLFSDCLPSVLVPTPPGGGIRPTRMMELREGRYNMSAAFAAGSAALDASGGAEALVVSNQTGNCEVTLSVSHLPERCAAADPTATATLPATARRAVLEIDITCGSGS